MINVEYFITLTVLLLITIALEIRYRVHLYHSQNERGIIVAIFFIIGVLWDSFAVWRGHWQFGNLIGIKIGLLPVEEYLFFLIIPFAVLTIYKILVRKIK